MNKMRGKRRKVGRNANHTGCVGYRASRRGPKKWYAWVAVTRPDGTEGKKYEYYLTKDEAEAARIRMVADHSRNRLVTVRNQTLEQYLNQWLESVVRLNLSPRTYAIYGQMSRLYIIPYLGRVRLAELNGQHLERWLARLKARKVRRTGQAMSQGGIHHPYRILRTALNRAKRLKLILDNPCKDIDPPSYRRPKVRPLRPELARALLDSVRGDRLEAFWTVALSMGLRPGEALGLTWSAIDWERGRNGTIEVRTQVQRDLDKRLVITGLKVDSSIRTLPMPAVCAAALRAHLLRQKEERLRAHMWEDNDLVFCTEGRRWGNVGGRPLEHRNLARKLQRLCEKAGIERATLYQLRHTVASLLHAQGASLHEIKEILGHSAITLTSDTYTHLYDEGKQVSADRIDRVYGTL